MRYYDPLYGEFYLPDYLGELLTSPEFQRLRHISLLNVHSASLAALGEAKRYSHTLGVLRLAMLNPMLDLNRDEIKAFLASIIVHDAGTPAYGHLFEYTLFDRFDWDHEEAALELLEKKHHPDGHLHQIFEGKTAQYRKLCEKQRINFDLVLAMFNRSHRYSELIFGTLDFDNLDNVARMCWYLGKDINLKSIMRIAENISVDSNRNIILPIDLRPDVDLWQAARRAAYDVIVFDDPTVAAQAVLSNAIQEAVALGALRVENWHLNDDELLKVLAETTSIRRKISRDFAGKLPKLTLLAKFDQFHDIYSEYNSNRGDLREHILAFLQLKRATKSRAYAYVFGDRGTFEKRLEFVDPGSRTAWSTGQRSASLVAYGFEAGAGRVARNPAALGREFEEWMATRQYKIRNELGNSS